MKTYKGKIDIEKRAIFDTDYLRHVYEDMQVVLSGLNADDKVIVQGLQKVQDGATVNPILVTK